MGCGQSSYEDDLYEKKYLEDLNAISKIPPEVLLNKLGIIQNISRGLNKDIETASKYTFKLLDDLTDVSKWSKWKTE